MKGKKITLMGQEVDIKFNMATEIEYERTTGRSFSIADATEENEDVADRSECILSMCQAAVRANNPDIDREWVDKIGKEATLPEYTELVKAVMEALAEWCAIPSILNKPAEDVEAEAEEKNG